MVKQKNSEFKLRLATIVISLLYAVVFLVMLILKPGTETFYKGFQNTYQIVPPLFAGICAFAYAKKGQHHRVSRRVGWLLIGIGSVLWATGQITWTYLETIRGLEVPSPCLTDAGYLGAYPLLLGGIILLFGGMPVVGRVRLLLDSAIAASAVGVLSWYFIVQKLWSDSEATLFAKIIWVSYPLVDIAVLFSALALFSASTGNKSMRRSSAFLAGGMILLAFADTTYNYYELNVEGGYQTGSWFDWSYSFGWMLIAYASLLSLWWPVAQAAAPEVEAESVPYPSVKAPSPWRLSTLLALLRVLIPYCAAAAAFAVIAVSDYRANHGQIANSVFIAGLWLIILVILRQVFTLLENQSLTLQLRAFNTNLEQIVARRTEQLTSLHELTKAINNTLAVSQVLSDAAAHAQRALQADAVVIRLVENAKEVENDREVESDADVQQPEQVPPVTFANGLQDHSHIREFIESLPLTGESEIRTLPPICNGAQSDELPGGKKQSDSVYLRAPLLWQGQIMGMIGVIRWDTEFGQTDAAMMESIGVEVGTALENARRYAAAVEAADRDSVTQLYNHRAIHQRLDVEFNRASRQNRPLAVIMMDLNNFKLFNDTYGHPIGDRILARVAHVLELECRKVDILGRYGGDEFIAVLPDTDEPLAMVVAQRLKERMLHEGFQLPGDERTIPITLSYGIATFPQDGINRFELLTIADANLYSAKLSASGIMGTSAAQRVYHGLRKEESFGVLDAMVTAVDNKDSYTRRHSEDVTEYSLWIAQEMGLSEATLRVIQVGGLLHDVGKIGVPDQVLRKPGKLTQEEYELMKRHPELGALIVGGVAGMEAIVDIVRSHHERWDGKGYPDGLAGEDIPFLGRLLAVADAYSAMTTARPYRKGMQWEAALQEIRNNIGTQFDPHIAEVFLKVVQERHEHKSPEPVPVPNLRLVPHAPRAA